MKISKTKKGYFFIIDGIFAIVILTIGFFLISSNAPEARSEIPVGAISADTISLLAETKIKEMCIDTAACICTNKGLEKICNQGLFRNTEQSILDLFGELYSLGKKSETRELFEGLIYDEGLIRADIFDIELRINNEKIFPAGDTKEKRELSKTLISSKRTVFGFSETQANGQISFFGPYLIEVDIWQK